MEFKDFLRKRRAELKISQADLADLLSSMGQETSSARIGHWETARNKPPLEDENFRHALAAALKMDVNELMSELGFVITDENRSREARRAADIIDRLPSEIRETALELLTVLEKRYSKDNL
jgi:transcriptional regulator with XRE-family HTH domain